MATSSLSEALQKTLVGVSSVRATTFDDESIKSSQVEGYKPKEGSVDRIAIIDPAMVAAGRSHYGGEGVGYVQCKSEWAVENGQETLKRKALCCQHMDEPKNRIVVPVVKYTTKPNGELVKPLSMEFLVWTINAEKFSQLRGIHKEWGLHEHDLIVQCNDEKYQRITVTVARERLLSHPDVEKMFGADVVAFATTIAPRLARQIGADLTDPQLMEKLGKAAPASSAKVSDTPVGNIDDLLK